MRPISALVPMVTGLLGLVTSAAAQVPVAVVEDVIGNPEGVEFMDYVTPKQVIKLGPSDTIVLGYMKSCWRETITGGTVVVGQETSLVHQSKVERVKVDCAGTRLDLSEGQARESAATVVRKIQPVEPTEQQPEVTIYGRSPIIEVGRGGRLVIERLDQRGEHHAVTVRGHALLRGRFYDSARARIALTPGAVYVARFGNQDIVFKVDRKAESGSTPIVGRLLRFEESR